jgi:hypothetical protein
LTKEGTELFVGNGQAIAIKSFGNMTLDFILRKILTLTNVAHVPEIRKKLCPMVF